MRLWDSLRNGKKTRNQRSARRSEARSTSRNRGDRGGGPNRRQQALSLALEQMESRTLLSAGSLDTTFGTGGIVVTDFSGSLDQAHAMVTLADGSMLVAGRATTNFDSDFALARYNADGSLDTTFGVNGLVTTDLGSTQDIAFAMVVQADGKIVLAGQTQSSATSFDFAVVRYNADGSLDSGFGAGGVVTADFHGNIDVAYDVDLDGAGNIVVAGTATDAMWSYRLGVLRLDGATGALDASFDGDGKAVIIVPETDGISLFDTEAYALDVAPDGKIVLGGYAFSFNTFEANALLVRLNTDGSLDTTFGSDPESDGIRTGYRTVDFAFDGETINDLHVLPSGEILVAGDAFGDLLISKFTAAGDLDTSFNGGNGMFLLDLAFMSDSARAIAVDDDGRIYAAGVMQADASAEFAVVRLNADGTADTTFDEDGYVLTDLGSMNDDQAMAISLGTDHVTIAGFTYNSSAGTDYDFALARYLIADAGDPENVAPVANAGGPYALSEGADVLLDGSASFDSDGIIVSYEWDLDYDGVNFDVDATGSTASFSAAGIDGDAVRTIALRVTDDGGASHVHLTTVDVLNAAPVADAGDDRAVVEGQLVELSGSVFDAGSADTHTLLWTVASSNGQVIDSGSGASFSFTPVDDGTYTVTFTATDDDGASGSDTVVIMVLNVAPTVLVAGDASGVRGQLRSFLGGFTDPGALDTHQVRWDFGDGTSTGWQTVSDPNIQTSHIFTATGTYNVTMYIRDKDGAVSSDSHTVAINVYEFQQLGDSVALFVGGTTGNDAIELAKAPQQLLSLHVNNTYYGTFNHSGRVIVYGQDGDDRISAFGIDNDAVLHGGAGDDSLTGGKGNDTLYGDAGADIFDGAQGINTIVRDADDPISNKGKNSGSAAAVRQTLSILSTRLRRGSQRVFRF